MCITAPCLLPESGTWGISKASNGTLRLRLTAHGTAARYFTAKKVNGDLVLTAAGKTQTLLAVVPPKPAGKFCGGIAGIQCAAGEECVDDPTDGCDPTLGNADCSGTCQAKASSPSADPCWGAWLDQNGVCRTPADGVYPATCCAK